MIPGAAPTEAAPTEAGSRPGSARGRPAPGRLIAFEGGEGTGKSTQAARLAEEIGAVLTREPGGTDLGRRLRSIALDPAAGVVDARAEALLMLADRAQHVAEVIAPALERGSDVVTDRYAGSTLAYQGWGRGLDVGELNGISRWAARGVDADLVVLLEVPVEVALRRLPATFDRMEAAGREFHERVAQGYKALAAGEPERWVVVDGSGSADATFELVVAAYRRWSAGGSG